MDEVRALQAQVGELEDRLQALQVRHSALEWIVEQHVAHYLAVDHPDRSASFLVGIRDLGGAAWRQTEEGQVPAPPNLVAACQRDVDHIVGKIAERVGQGLRYG